jgi:hypothetical protein
MAPAKMKLFTLALGALGLAGLSVGQEGPTSIVVVTEVSTLPESTAMTQPATRVGRGDPVAKDTPPPRGGTTIVYTMPCASPPCAAITPAPTSFPYTTYTTCNINFPIDHTCKVTTESCGGKSTLSTESQYLPDCGDWYTETTPCPKIITSTVTTCYSSGYTPVPMTGCPAGTCGPACRPDVHCRKKVKFGREASPTSQDLGGRSQRAVAREAKPTLTAIPTLTRTVPFCTPGSCHRGCHPHAHCFTKTDFGREALPTSQDLGGRSQRYVAREAKPTFTQPCHECSDGMPLPTTTPLSETPRIAGALPRCTFADGQYICPTPKADREAPCTTNDLGGRSQRAVDREALPTSNDLGGRSQRYVAREAKPTFTQPCHGGVCFTGTPDRPTKTFDTGPLPVPTLADGMPPNFSIPTQSDPWRKVKPTARPTATKPHYSILPSIKSTSAAVSTLRTVARKA